MPVDLIDCIPAHWDISMANRAYTGVALKLRQTLGL